MNMNGTCVPDNTCGSGTTADSTGQCVPDGSVVCTDGTKFDMTTGTCVIDPNSCQDGTVLINGACVDPTKGLTVDVEEAAEPNGAGLIESSTAPAGTITLKPVGGPGVVIHGTIAPFQDADMDGQMDPDVDTYVLTVNAPVLLHVTADGVGGIDAGVVAVAVVNQNDPLANWVRFGMNVTGDTSKRQIYLPAAGTYALAVADTRTLFQYSTGGPINAAPGPGDYYITIDQLAMPTPTAITPASGVATQTGTIAPDADVQFFTTTMGAGFNDTVLTTTSSQMVPSVVLSNNGAFRNVGTQGTDALGNPVPAEVLAGGILPTDTPVIAVDNEYDTGIGPVDYTLTVTQGNATALSNNGGTASEAETSNAPQAIADFNTFYYDVAAADESTGMKLSWNHPVDGLIVDQDLNIFAPFTFDPANGFTGATFASYTGLLRHPAPGRYYFLVYDPNTANAGNNLVATSTYGALTPTAITEGTATGSTQVGPYNSNPFTYAKGADPWQQFAEITSNAGNVTLSLYDPATTYGRLDRLNITPAGGGAATNTPGDATAIAAPVLPSAGTAVGRVVLADAPTTYFIKANAANTTSTDSYTLTISKKQYVDFGAINAGDAAVTKTANSIMSAGGSVDFFVQTNSAANLLKFVGTPTGTPQPDIALHELNADESTALTVNTVGTGAETMVVPAQAQKWVAVSVTGTTAGTFDMSSVVTAEGTYAQSNPGSTFLSICTPGTTVTMHDDGSGFGASDEGLSNPISVPSGFQLFGASVAQIQISTNGWASFQTNQSSAAFANVDMPDAGDPNALIAPYWTDLAGVQVCTVTAGSVMTIEWRGATLGGTNVAMQAQLNATNNTITFVYDSAANMADDGSDATVGVEDFSGAAASKVEYDTAGTITPGKSIRFTPM